MQILTIQIKLQFFLLPKNGLGLYSFSEGEYIQDETEGPSKSYLHMYTIRNMQLMWISDPTKWMVLAETCSLHKPRHHSNPHG